MNNKKSDNFPLILSVNREKHMESFRKNIDRCMDKYDVTLAELAEKADIPYGTLSTVLYGGKDDCKLSTAIKISRVFGLSLDEMVGAGTMEDITYESLQMFRELPEHTKYMLRWLIRHHHHINKENTVHGEKLISVFKPLCRNGHLEMTNAFETVCIDNMTQNVKAKVFIGLQLPCDHYMPVYSPHDILLIASDREARDGDHCVVTYYGKVFIVEKKIRKGESGTYVEYVGLVDPSLRIKATEIDEKVGYIVTVLNQK